jgi:putative transposase
MTKAFMYLVAIIDWYLRRVLSWRVSNTPEIFNTDQGSQSTSETFTDLLKNNGVAISMDGKGRWVDNVFVERLWRSVKHEDVYLRAYETALDLRLGLTRYFCVLQHPARPQRTGPTHPGCGVF